MILLWVTICFKWIEPYMPASWNICHFTKHKHLIVFWSVVMVVVSFYTPVFQIKQVET